MFIRRTFPLGLASTIANQKRWFGSCRLTVAMATKDACLFRKTIYSEDYKSHNKFYGSFRKFFRCWPRKFCLSSFTSEDYDFVQAVFLDLNCDWVAFRSRRHPKYQFGIKLEGHTDLFRDRLEWPHFEVKKTSDYVRLTQNGDRIKKRDRTYSYLEAGVLVESPSLQAFFNSNFLEALKGNQDLSYVEKYQRM